MQSIFTVVILSFYNIPIAAFTFVLFPIYLILSYYSTVKWGKEEEKKNKIEDYSRGRIQEVIANMSLVKSFTNEKNEFNEVSKSLGKINSFDAKYIMLDAFKEGEFGGTGMTFDHSALKNNAGHLKAGKMLFIAGGLRPGNVAGVVRKLKPFAVDVASGVEDMPGKKSFAKMRKFIGEVRSVQ